MVYHNQQQSALINLLNADLFRVIFLTPLGKLVLRQVCRLFFDMWPGLLAELKHRSLRVDVYERSTTEIHDRGSLARWGSGERGCVDGESYWTAAAGPACTQPHGANFAG